MHGSTRAVIVCRLSQVERLMTGYLERQGGVTGATMESTRLSPVEAAWIN